MLRQVGMVIGSDGSLLTMGLYRKLYQPMVIESIQYMGAIPYEYHMNHRMVYYN